MRKLNFVQVGFLFCLLICKPAATQIVPDATLPNNSLIINQNNTSLIEGGTRAGGNLFHSFEDFSVPNGGTAYFNNVLDVQNIITRVTGSSISNLNGLIKANGTANLFLLNPNGIIFGPNAQMNIGGSILVSTASNINFSDGTQFSAKVPQTIPLLTVSVPLGLQFRGNPGAIHVQGPGHNLIGPGFSPIIRDSSSTAGLQVQPGKSLVIVGGDVSIDGGTLTTEAGRIELGSVGSGLVSLSPTPQGWTLGYEQVQSFQDILLSRRALADASGVGSSFIQVQGRRVTLSDGSVILIQNQGLLPAGTLSVNASESLEISGTDPVARIIGSLTNETQGFGNGGDIAISTPKLVLQLGGAIVTRTFGPAKAGSITVNAPKSIQVIGASPVDVRAASVINSITFGSGKAGDIKVKTGQLNATGGGLLISTTSGTGAGGDVIVDAAESVTLIGVEQSSFLPSSISASTLNAGSAGTVVINTSRLVVRDGGRVDSSTIASGSAGSVEINASDSVEVSGAVPGSQNFSLVISSANILEAV